MRCNSPHPKEPSTVPHPFTVASDGFSLNAAVARVCRARARGHRAAVSLCHRAAFGRPALALERLSSNSAGQVVYQLKTPYQHGTTHFVFEPLDFVLLIP